MTVRHLMTALAAARVRLEAGGTTLYWVAEGGGPADDLIDALAVLHTGVRAVITGRRWFGIDCKTGRPCGPQPKACDGLLGFGALDPGRKLPHNVGLLSVEGDPIWDRVAPLARLDLPHLFAPEPDRGHAR